MAGKKDLTIYQGATFKCQFVLEQVINKVTTPIDLYDCSVRMQIRPSHRSNEVYLDLGELGYIFVSDAVTGEVSIEIPASATQELDFSSAVYDIEIEFNDGFVMRMVEGRVTLSLEVTR